MAADIQPDPSTGSPFMRLPTSPSPSEASSVTLAGFDVPPYHFKRLDTICDALETASIAACLEMEDTIAWRRKQLDLTNTSRRPLEQERATVAKIEVCVQTAMSHLSGELQQQQASWAKSNGPNSNGREARRGSGRRGRGRGIRHHDERHGDSFFDELPMPTDNSQNSQQSRPRGESLIGGSDNLISGT
jgi:hypothetical protein